MDEGAQRVESYFERARVREETGSGGTATSSGSATVVTHAQTPKRKADDETVGTDTQSKKRQTADAAMPRVCKSEDQAARDLLQCPQSKESWYHQKYRRTRGTPSKTWRSVN